MRSRLKKGRRDYWNQKFLRPTDLFCLPSRMIKLQKTVRNLSLSSKLSPVEGYTKLIFFRQKNDGLNISAAALPETGQKTVSWSSPCKTLLSRLCRQVKSRGNLLSRALILAERKRRSVLGITPMESEYGLDQSMARFPIPPSDTYQLSGYVLQLLNMLSQ